MDGILLFNKPILWTSHDAVDFFRRRLGQKKVGHAGSLDPMATGLLLILLGEATKASSRLSGLDKDYSGAMTLGFATDTQDLEGKIISEADGDSVTEGRIEEVLTAFEGDYDQVPPAFSSVKKNGMKLYEWARRGVTLSPEARRVQIKRFKLTTFFPPEAYFSLTCSKGTYVRALCDETGRILGCGATLSCLVRTRVGMFHLKNSLTEQEVLSSSPDFLKKKVFPQ